MIIFFFFFLVSSIGNRSDHCAATQCH